MRKLEPAGPVALALIIIAVLAVPVLREPSTRIFGSEIMGRHHDPFTVMSGFAYPVITGTYAQPVTDGVGALLARGVGPVAAYNALVLLSFPLAAFAAFLLARHIGLAPRTSALVALAYAFSPFHLAHAAYHPHVAQVHWIPLYFLALWRSLDKASLDRRVWLVLAAIAVTWSNFYGGLIVGVLTPVAVVTYWWFWSRANAGAGRQVIRTGATLAALAVGGMVYVWWTAPAVWTNPAAFAFPRNDLHAYSAQWWSYAVPPMASPWLGDIAQRIWTAWDVRAGVIEQQVSLGLGVIALGFVAIVGWWTRSAPSDVRRIVPLLSLLACAALICSLSPERTIAGVRVVRPSALLYEVLPMFRSYARFGVVVQLMAVLLAGVGLERLWRSGRLAARALSIALVGLALGEYAVLPATLWRDVLPTSAHRWVMQLRGPVHVLDCAPLTVESASVEWLTERRIRMADGDTDCFEPGLPDRLAAEGYTHVLLRQGSWANRLGALRHPVEGLLPVHEVTGSRVFAVTASTPPVYTARMHDFFEREVNGEWTWRWMGSRAAWTIVNTGDAHIDVGLSVELQAFGGRRHLRLVLNGHEVALLTVDTAREFHTVPSLVVPPGHHTLEFVPLDAPTAADAQLETGDRRGLSVAVGGWRWSIGRDRR